MNKIITFPIFSGVNGTLKSNQEHVTNIQIRIQIGCHDVSVSQELSFGELFQYL